MVASPPPAAAVVQPQVRNSPPQPSAKNAPSVATATKIPQPTARVVENSRYGFRRELRQPTHFSREGYKTAPARQNQGQNNFRGSAKIRPATRCSTRTFKNSRCFVNFLRANFPVLRKSTRNTYENMAAESPAGYVRPSLYKTAIIMTSIGLHVGKFGAKYTDDELFRALNVGADIYQLWRRNQAGDTFVYVRSAPNAVITAARLLGRTGPNGEKLTPVLVRKLNDDQMVALATLFAIDR